MPSLALDTRRSFAIVGLAGALATPAIALAADSQETASAATRLPGLTVAAPVLDVAADLHRVAKRRQVRLTTLTASHLAKARHDKLGRGYSTHLWAFSIRELRVQQRHMRQALRALRTPKVSIPPQLAAIAACESGGNPRAIGGGGAFRGKYQFTYSTWAAVGGSGDPAAAPEAEQDRRAAMLYNSAGAGQWPVCGR